MSDALTAITIIVVGVALYFLPTIIAERRKKVNHMAIFLVNFLLGWTVIGWIVALVWAVTVDNPLQVVRQ
jgi:hypothetical protein